jgi:hypothetical protein
VSATGRKASTCGKPNRDPIWRDRSDFIIGADFSNYSDGATTEMLWARQVRDDAFKLCCISFFVFNPALGDVVRTSPAGDVSTWSLTSSSLPTAL